MFMGIKLTICMTKKIITMNLYEFFTKKNVYLPISMKNTGPEVLISEGRHKKIIVIIYFVNLF